MRNNAFLFYFGKFVIRGLFILLYKALYVRIEAVELVLSTGLSGNK